MNVGLLFRVFIRLVISVLFFYYSFFMGWTKLGVYLVIICKSGFDSEIVLYILVL